ncbi:rRNA maturation RNase YbeY [Chloroflexota bacterium]
MKLGIQIDKEFRKYFKEEWLQLVVEKSLAVKDFDSEVELSLLITGEEKVRELNKQYRGLDEPTDVLSFALTERTLGDDNPFITPPDGILHLGEVVISYPQAARQAGENRQGTEQELALLIVHGVLHLLGYEHDEPDREQEMRALEQRVLSEIEKLLK